MWVADVANPTALTMSQGRSYSSPMEVTVATESPMFGPAGAPILNTN